MTSDTSENTTFVRFYLTFCYLMITVWNCSQSISEIKELTVDPRGDIGAHQLQLVHCPSRIHELKHRLREFGGYAKVSREKGFHLLWLVVSILSSPIIWNRALPTAWSDRYRSHKFLAIGRLVVWRSLVGWWREPLVKYRNTHVSMVVNTG